MAIERSYALREAIKTQFDKMRSLADMLVSPHVHGARTLSIIRTTVIWMAALVAALLPARAQTKTPETPAVRALTAWLKSFTSADPNELSTFHERFDPQDATGFMASMREQTGRL